MTPSKENNSFEKCHSQGTKLLKEKLSIRKGWNKLSIMNKTLNHWWQLMIYFCFQMRKTTRFFDLTFPLSPWGQDFSSKISGKFQMLKHAVQQRQNSCWMQHSAGQGSIPLPFQQIYWQARFPTCICHCVTSNHQMTNLVSASFHSQLH